MATTARDTVYGALRLIGAVPSGEVPAAQEAADGLAALNAMLHGWKNRGVDVSHVDLALSDAVALGQEFHEGVKYLLAVRLAPEYERPPAPELMSIADNAWRAIQMAHGSPTDLTVEGGLLKMPGEYWGRGTGR